MHKNKNENSALPPLSLYVHIPWCIKKCPYCDFNSHTHDTTLPIQAYLTALKHDLSLDKHLAQDRKIHSIFFGGGTPSLFPNWAIKELLDYVKATVGYEPNIEITLEANPATIEHDTFTGLKAAGVNRLSIGVQSFNNASLTALGRIHNNDDARNAFTKARDAGFNNINIDLMHGLPQQTTNDGLSDLQQAIDLNPEHISWYQLTIEPNTHFYSSPPTLPTENILADIQQLGGDLLQQAGFKQYEISAFSQNNQPSKHNMNYWHFGDYLAIGAGAHGKITTLEPPSHPNQTLTIHRYNKTRLPEHYLHAPTKHPLTANPYTAGNAEVTTVERPVEFMMNALRLINGVPVDLFAARTGLAFSDIAPIIESLQHEGLLIPSSTQLSTSDKGCRYLDEVLARFT